MCSRLSLYVINLAKKQQHLNKYSWDHKNLNSTLLFDTDYLPLYKTVFPDGTLFTIFISITVIAVTLKAKVVLKL